MENIEQNITNRKYKKKDNFKFNIIFNNKGENFQNIVERTFEKYCLIVMNKKAER